MIRKYPVKLLIITGIMEQCLGGQVPVLIVSSALLAHTHKGVHNQSIFLPVVSCYILTDCTKTLRHAAKILKKK